MVLDKSILVNDKPKASCYPQNKEITNSKIIVYNRHTQRFSEKSIYYNEKKVFILRETLLIGIKHLITSIISTI